MRLLTLAYISIAVLAYADAASCQDAEPDELERWIPSFGFSGGIVRQTASGFLQSNVRPPDDGIFPPGPFPGTPSTGDGPLVDPFVLFATELMTPGLRSIPAQPRLFVHGEVGGAFGSQVELASEGAPGEFDIPTAFPDIPALAIGGQGMETTLEIGTLMAGAGAGIAFTADLFDRRFRLKPSFEYLRHEVEAEGVFKHVTDMQIPNPPPPNRTRTVIDELFSFHAQKTRTLHSIGGGIELEMDTLRAGPFVLALFANAQAYWLLSDPDIHLSGSNGTVTATWEVSLDREIYRGAVGLRFRFLPEQ